MKKVLIGLLLSIGLVGMANAQEMQIPTNTIMFNNNTKGGETIITDGLGACPVGRFWYSTDANGSAFVNGCWLFSDTNPNKIVAVNSIGGTFVWNISDFVVTEYGHELYGLN